MGHAMLAGWVGKGIGQALCVQRQRMAPCPVEHRARRHRNLVSARPTPPQPSAGQQRRAVTFAPRTPVTVRPSARGQILSARVLVRKPSLKLDDRPRKLRPTHAFQDPNLKWYLEVVGVDFKYASEAINRAPLLHEEATLPSLTKP